VRLPAGDPEEPRLVKFDAPVRERPRKKTRARGDEARQRILDAALECFAAFGFEGASTRAIADRAGSTHTSIIYHFHSKEQLWIATMEHVLADYMKAIGGGAGGGIDDDETEDPKTTLSGFIENFVRMSARFPQIHRILTMESTQGTPRLAWIIDHFLRDHFTFMKQVIIRGQQAGLVRQCDPARLYYLIIGAGGTPFTVWNEYGVLTGRDVFSDAEVYRIIAFIHEIVFQTR
jgi:TetR/AcrR family transcriptional regulator